MQEELNLARRLAKEAGEIALTYYKKNFTIDEKIGHGPVTEADHAINSFLVRAVKERFPTDGVLAEESVDDEARLSCGRLWAIDPIDGTREFIAQTGEFSAMIGFAIDRVPVVGAIYQPTTGKLYYAGKGLGAWLEQPGQERRRLSVTQNPFSALRMAVAKPWRGRRVEVIRSYLGIQEIVPIGSISLKLAMIAAGEADLYVNPSSYLAEWDTCAGEAIIREAGGMVTDLVGRALSYNNADVTRPLGVVASHGVCHPQILRGIRDLRARLVQEGAISSTSIRAVYNTPTNTEEE